MRTLLSQLEMARKSGPFGAGEKERSEMVSVGGSESATSCLRSPTVLLVVAAAEAPPKRVDMVAVCWRREVESQLVALFLSFCPWDPAPEAQN